jgi:hypothetical protein
MYQTYSVLKFIKLRFSHLSFWWIPVTKLWWIPILSRVLALAISLLVDSRKPFLLGFRTCESYGFPLRQFARVESWLLKEGPNSGKIDAIELNIWEKEKLHSSTSTILKSLVSSIRVIQIVQGQHLLNTLKFKHTTIL